MSKHFGDKPAKAVFTTPRGREAYVVVYLPPEYAEVRSVKVTLEV